MAATQSQSTQLTTTLEIITEIILIFNATICKEETMATALQMLVTVLQVILMGLQVTPTGLQAMVIRPKNLTMG